MTAPLTPEELIAMQEHAERIDSPDRKRLLATIASRDADIARLKAPQEGEDRDWLAKLWYYEHCGCCVSDGDYEKGVFPSDIERAKCFADAILAAGFRRAPIRVSVGCMSESNGRETWFVTLHHEGDDTKFGGLQIYSDAIEGRARYEAERLKHFFGQAPEPDILAFDTSAPTPPQAEDGQWFLATDASHILVDQNGQRGIICKWNGDQLRGQQVCDFRNEAVDSAFRRGREAGMEEAAILAEEHPWNYERYHTASILTFEKLRNDTAKSIRAKIAGKGEGEK